MKAGRMEVGVPSACPSSSNRRRQLTSVKPTINSIESTGIRHTMANPRERWANRAAILIRMEGKYQRKKMAVN